METTTVVSAAMGWWDWIGVVGFVFGVVAFLMAVQPFTQVLFGEGCN